MKIFQVPDWRQNKLVYCCMIAMLAAMIAIVLHGCASAPGAPSSGPLLGRTLCAAAQVELERCASGKERDARRCAAASATAFVCSVGSRPVEHGLLSSTLKSGVGLTPRTLQTCWRTLPGGPQKFGTGRLDVDPWEAAGIPGAPQGALPCGRPEVNDAFRQAFGQPCIGDGAALGGYCGGPSNEVLRGAPPKLAWACQNRPDLIGSTGSSEWNCSPGGVDLLRLAAFVGGTQMMAAIDAAMGNLPPAPRCGDGRRDPGETCSNCPADAGPCAPPPPPDPRLDCSSLSIPAPDAPRFVGISVGTNSTGLAGYRLVECRGGSLPTPEPERPAISSATRATLAALCGWYPKSWASRRARCAVAIAEVLGVDDLATLDGGDR